MAIFVTQKLQGASRLQNDSYQIHSLKYSNPELFSKVRYVNLCCTVSKDFELQPKETYFKRSNVENTEEAANLWFSFSLFAFHRSHFFVFALFVVIVVASMLPS